MESNSCLQFTSTFLFASLLLLCLYYPFVECNLRDRRRQLGKCCSRSSISQACQCIALLFNGSNVNLLAPQAPVHEWDELHYRWLQFRNRTWMYGFSIRT